MSLTIPQSTKPGPLFAGVYRRGVRSGLAMEMDPSYSTFTYGTVDDAGRFTGFNISQVKYHTTFSNTGLG